MVESLFWNDIEIYYCNHHLMLRMEQEIILEMSRLLDKTGLENVIPDIALLSENSDHLMESALISLKSLTARYDKSEALQQVQWLMNTYNIQIDELMERITT
jgi:hypothetical protein